MDAEIIFPSRCPEESAILSVSICRIEILTGIVTATLGDNAGVMPVSYTHLSYRKIYPNPLTHPGFTYPSDNLAKTPEKITSVSYTHLDVYKRQV